MSETVTLIFVSLATLGLPAALVPPMDAKKLSE